MLPVLRRAWGMCGSLRPLLVLLSLLTTAPLLALLLHSALDERQQTLERARAQAAALARLGAEQQGDMVAEAMNLLRVLARVPAVQAGEADACHALLRQVGTDHPRVTVLAMAHADGRVACNNATAQPSINLSDRAYFQRALQARQGALVSSGLIVGRSTGRPTVSLATPLPPGADGRPGGVLVASLNLEWLSQLADRLPGAAGQLVQVLDGRDGTMLARSAGAGDWVGRAFPNHPVLAAYRAQPGGGVLDAPDLEGTDRITGFAPLPGDGAEMVVSIGLARASVLAGADRRLRRDLTVAGGVALAAVLLSWLLASRALLRPILALAAGAARLGAGDFALRVAPAPGAVRELRRLAWAFSAMARQLAAREREVAAMGAELARSEAQHRLLSETSNDMITLLDLSFRRSYVSPACRELLGHEPAELLGRHPADFIHPDDREAQAEGFDAALRAGEPALRATYRAMRKDGRTVWLESSGRRLASGEGYVVVTRDVSERKAMEERLEAANRRLETLAMEDPLTGLANRRRFDEVLGREFRRAMRTQAPLAIIMLDVDRFKAFNDTYGHPAGDACLQAVTRAIGGVLRRPGDLGARYGGEEFAVLLPGTDEAGAAVMAERIRSEVRALALPHAGSEAGIVTVSLGVATMLPPIGAHGPARFIEAADAALYAAKRGGRDTVRQALQPADEGRPA